VAANEIPAVEFSVISRPNTHKRDQRINSACDLRVNNANALDRHGGEQRTALAGRGIEINAAALIVDTSASFAA
jgi:hypothetical protein